MMSKHHLAQLVKLGRFAEAKALCLSALNEEPDQLYWETQLGYVYFLDFKNLDIEAYTIPIFESVAAQQPSNANAHFWLGYVNGILASGDMETFRQEIDLVVANLDPDHPYANLLLAEFEDLEYEDRIRHFSLVLKEQRVNMRAYQRLIELAIGRWRRSEARNAYRSFHHIPAFIETQYGIMNDYINEVLTKAAQAESVRREIRSKIRKWFIAR